MPWVQLIGAFVGAAAKPVNVSAPDPSEFQLQTSPVTVVATIAGIGGLAALAWWALKK